MSMNFLVTAAGSTIAQGIIKSIKSSGMDCNIITTDNQPYAAGLYRGKASYLVPLAKSPDFIDEIIRICRKENIDGIFVGTDYELLKFAENKGRIESETGASVFVSPPEIIRISDDKWLTHKFMEENGFPTIPSVLSHDADKIVKEVGFPLVVKPRIGDSSKDMFVVHNEEELIERINYHLSTPNKNKFLSEKSEPIIQKYIGSDDEEYTSTTTVFDGQSCGVLSMKREMRYPGHTTKAIIKDFPQLNAMIKKVAETLKPFGPCNFQSRIVNGVPHVFEINCRFSGTTASCTISGFNPVLNCIRKTILKEELTPFSYKEGVVLRYFNELFIPYSEIEKMKEVGELKFSNSIINKNL